MTPIATCHFPVASSPQYLGGEDVCVVDLGFDKLEQLSSLCASEHLSRATVIKVVWALVLRRFVDSDNVCFGLVRLHPNTENEAPSGQIHCQRVNTFGMDSVLDLIDKVEADTWSAKSTVLAPDPPPFNTTLQLLDDDATVQLDMPDTGRAILLVASATGFCLNFQTKLVTKMAVMNVAYTFEKALSSILTNPRRSIASLDMLSDRDVRQIAQWNCENPEKLRRDVCIFDLIKDQVDRHPHWIAVDAWDGHLTFVELWKLSSRLVALLIERGVKSETFVPFCFETCKWGVVTMLAILRAGGVCVPLEPSDPSSRIDAILQEIRPTVAIAATSQRAKLLGKVPVLLTDLPTLLQSQHVACPLLPDISLIDASDPGVPKGIIQEHGAICTSISHLTEVLHVSYQSRVFQNAAYIFDVSVADIFGTMARGGCVCCALDHQRDTDLAGALTLFRATHVCVTPTHLAQLHPTDVPSLRHVSVGGESLNRAEIEMWADKLCLSNIYGTTESTIWCTLNEQVQVNSDPTNIGRPFGCATWIVDSMDHHKLVPIGAVGELLIEGPNLARGYLAHNRLTDQCFVTVSDLGWFKKLRNDGKQTIGSRLYKTGDLVRYEVDGTIKYLGRKDTQVKLQCHRVELGEIEYYLRQHLPAAAQAVACVMDPQDGAREGDLAVFICLSGQNGISGMSHATYSLDMASLHKQLTEVLPSYMVPSILITVADVPRTPSGKTDRKKLKTLSFLAYSRFDDVA